MQIVVTVLVIVVVLGFAVWVFSRIAGGWLSQSDERRKSTTADQLYDRYGDAKKR